MGLNSTRPKKNCSKPQYQNSRQVKSFLFSSTWISNYIVKRTVWNVYLDFAKMVLNWGLLLPSIQKKKYREFRLEWLFDCSDFSFFFPFKILRNLKKGHAISRVHIIQHERSYAQYPISFPRSKFNQVSMKKNHDFFFRTDVCLVKGSNSNSILE